MKNEEPKTKIRQFTDLEAWKSSRVLVKNVYRACYLYPKEEQYGLVSQMKRSSVSVASNIAEGFKRDTMKDKVHFYVMAHGSLIELQNQIILSLDLQFIDDRSYDDLMSLCERADKLLTGLIRASKERL
ncbi:four helix bundle protein [Candidatus Saccharibacteria bacterium]|nr:MAG: four helix bundle protein [Candidatus Saccharibacteria bacterium]